eukprot:CAMPEP_0184862490 /NCGR_PEP_ID=MMETSP0580-20130426/6946_1 /TAXON_ID=1118495 /ORGANISM="Dactyliosolen fragilissimus" /LENGTH=292 /DNA_ID=CAMNT_0027360381 /DNA_START=88 /DNA_END=963 /DNA_ORIENTATION=-
MSVRIVLLEYVCPTLGAILGNIMFAAPVKDVRAAVKKGTLGNLNPTPWAFMTGNCAGWVAYSYLTSNLFVFFGNAPALILSLWLNMCAVKLQYHENLVEIVSSKHDPTNTNVNLNADPETNLETTTNITTYQNQKENEDITKHGRDKTSKTTSILHSLLETTQQTKVMWMIFIWVIVISIVSLLPSLDANQKQFIIGIIVNVNLLFFYGAPLSTIHAVLSTRNSSSIHIPTAITNTANGTFWGAYGLSVWDPFIFVPNLLGALLGAFQIVFLCIFPKGESSKANNNTTKEES